MFIWTATSWTDCSPRCSVIWIWILWICAIILALINFIGPDLRFQSTELRKNWRLVEPTIRLMWMSNRNLDIVMTENGRMMMQNLEFEGIKFIVKKWKISIKNDPQLIEKKITDFIRHANLSRKIIRKLIRTHNCSFKIFSIAQLFIYCKISRLHL